MSTASYVHWQDAGMWLGYLVEFPDYLTQEWWSRALWEHGDQPDGILYRSRYDDSALCVAVYDRAKDGLAMVQDHSLGEDPQQMGRLLRRYGLGLTN